MTPTQTHEVKKMPEDVFKLTGKITEGSSGMQRSQYKARSDGAHLQYQQSKAEWGRRIESSRPAWVH
jgi:hypothetical protein